MSEQANDSDTAQSGTFPPDADAGTMADRETPDHVEEDETAAGPAERNDPGNDNPATTSPVE